MFVKSTKALLLWEQGVAGSNPATSTIDEKASFIEAFLFINLDMPSNVKRKLAAIMFTDIARYTALSSTDENKALKLLDKQEEILTPIIEEFNGTLHNRIGDGLLFTFPTVTDAIKCGIKIQKKTKEVEDLNLRIGIHEGEIAIKNGDVLGDDVNVASRIDPFAAEGGIVISGKVQQNISSLPEFKTKFISEPLLKGVNQDVKIFCIVSHGLPETDITKVTAKLEKDVKKLWHNQKFIWYLGVAVISIIGILFLGGNLIKQSSESEKLMNEDEKVTKTLIHFTSLSDRIPHMLEHLTLEPGTMLSPIDEEILDSLKTYFSVQLINLYFGDKKEFIIPKEKKEVNYLNNHPLLSVDLVFTDDRSQDVKFWKNSADSIYYNFNEPDKTIYFNIYKILAAKDSSKYIITETNFNGHPNQGNNGDHNRVVISISKLFDEIKELITDKFDTYKGIGHVLEVNDDIIMVNVENKNVREDMEIIGTSVYNFTPGNNGYENRLEDLKNALDYMNKTNEYDYTLEQSYRKIYDSLLEDSLYCKNYDEEGVHVGGCVQTRDNIYYLKVINIIDSIAVTKVIKYSYPWVQPRMNDDVFVKTN